MTAEDTQTTGRSARKGNSDWYQQIARIIAETNAPSFAETLTEAIRDFVGFQYSVIFGYPPARRPVFLFDGFGDHHRSSTVAPYLNGTYLVDPFYHACKTGIDPGLYRMRDLAPDEFYETVGSQPGYISPCISDMPGYLSEEIGYFSRNEHGTYLVLSLMRPHDAAPFSEAEFVWLNRIAPIVCSAMGRHWSDLGMPTQNEPGAGSMGDIVEDTFNSFGDRVLTEREQDVARLILRGHSSESIGHILEIAVPTVKIHRRNIYAKFHISSQSELFALFIDTLSTT